MPREQTESQPVLPELFYLLKGKYSSTKQSLFLYESRKPARINGVTATRQRPPMLDRPSTGDGYFSISK